MTAYSATVLQDLTEALQSRIDGEVHTDLAARILYSTDASIYQIEPLGVVFPRSLDDLQAIMETCAGFEVPVLARGAGSSLAGQAVGEALVVDCSRYLNHILEIDPETKTAQVEPGVVLNYLNRAAAKYDLQFGPDPASGERATMGGSLANNATGAHSIRYGMAADHLLSVDAVLADGSRALFEQISLQDAERIALRSGAGDLEATFYQAALQIREGYAGIIQSRWPRTWRRASGYNLNYLLPWSPSAPPLWQPRENDSIPYPPLPPDHLNLSTLIAGSEGTLALIRRATVRLVPVPRHTILGVLSFASIPEACDRVPELLEYQPSAVELIPQSLIHLARSVPAYAAQLNFVQGDPQALLVIEFTGNNPVELKKKARALADDVLIAESAAEQSQVWAVRKVGLGLLMSMAGDEKPWPFIEDLAVPVERLGEFVREMERIVAAHHTQVHYYAHASAGCLHIRPIVNIKNSQGIQTMRSIAEQAVGLTVDLGGAVSGEHGDGLARSEWLERMYGAEILSAFRELKSAADPKNLLNPGKIVPAGGSDAVPPMDANLRFSPGYNAQVWPTVLDFSQQSGLDGAVEQCNGAGVCRKSDGVMCPSFQATQDETHSTRGRANLMRAMLTGRFPSSEQAEKAVYEALDLCLACKGCKSECPSAVDMAKLKYEFLQRYYESRSRKPRDYLFGFIGLLARLGSPFTPILNPILQSSFGRILAARLFEVSASRPLPTFSSVTFKNQIRPVLNGFEDHETADEFERVLFLVDAFTNYFYPEAGIAAVKALQDAGCRVELLPILGTGRTLISKGFLTAAKRHAGKLLAAIEAADPEGRCAIVGVEPSEIYTLREEYLDLFPGDPLARKAAERAYMIDEFLVRPGKKRDKRILRIATKGAGELNGHSKDLNGGKRKVLLHGHCYQKTQPPAADGYPTGVSATVEMLECLGFQVEVIDSGCCGMAGAFGYEKEHFELSMQVGELKLFPAVRDAKWNTIIAASGVSCQEQIKDGAERDAVHPITLIEA